MEEANGFRALLNLEEPKYSVEQIATAKTGKIARRMWLGTRLKTDRALFPWWSMPSTARR